jgi:hypothetical protein
MSVNGALRISDSALAFHCVKIDSLA